MNSKLNSAVDILISPAVLISAVMLKLVRRAGVRDMPVSRAIFNRVGVFPIEDHYYEPLFNPIHLDQKFSEPRDLPAIDWNLITQLEVLTHLIPFATEVPNLPNTSFWGADAEYWYCILRYLKPHKVVEVGSGNSTRVAISAMKANAVDCEHVCIEPYEQPWLESSGASVLRERLEDVDRTIFRGLCANDILFIDSSHVIRPQGDVLTEVLEILPTLSPGVVVHFHDIFSPRHYHYKWVAKEVRLWNEQYLVEAFLSHNSEWEVLGALNYLSHEVPNALSTVCRGFSPDQEPGSFYIRRKVR